MTTATRCYTPIKGRVLRLIKLNECGVPVTGVGSNSVVVASGFTQVQQSAQFETGDEHLVRTADALLCVNEKDPDILKRLELTVDFCQIDPGIMAVTQIARLLTFSEAPTGTGFAVSEGALTGHFSLEVWQRVSGAAACDPAGVTRYVYNAWPHLMNPKFGDYTIGTDPSSLQLIAESARMSSLWTVGNTWLGVGAVSALPEHWMQNLTTAAPPTAACGITDA